MGALYPAVTFKNVSLLVNFGPELLTPLPFVARTVQDAAQADTEVTAVGPPKDGKYEVLFPLGTPDEGTFEWANQFLEQNTHFSELSHRMVIEWAKKSGLPQAPGKTSLSI